MDDRERLFYAQNKGAYINLVNRIANLLTTKDKEEFLRKKREIIRGGKKKNNDEQQN